MKKLTYLLAAAAVFAACNSGNKGYTVTGTVEGAADGDTVYLQTAEGRQLVKLDSAVITNGTFTFKGTQDSAVNRYITCQPSGKEGVLMDFFLENGAINIKLTSGEGDSATGTANNDIYQRIRDKQNELNRQMNAIYQSMSDTALTDEQREAKAKQMNDLEEQYIATAKEGIKQNINNAVGVFLLKKNHYYMDVEELKGEGEPLPLILWTFTEEIRTLLKCKIALENGQSFSGIAKTLRLWGPRERLMQAAVNRLDKQDIRTALQQTAQIDRIIKGLHSASWMDDAWDALTQLGLSLAHP